MRPPGILPTISIGCERLSQKSSNWTIVSTYLFVRLLSQDFFLSVTYISYDLCHL